MADLVVIYDPTFEVASIVDLDKLIGWGPMLKGTDAQEILEGFIAAAPFDVSILTSEQAKEVFWSMPDAIKGATAPEAGAIDPGPVGDDSQPTGSELGAAEAEATNAGTVPAVQPADTDAESTAPDTAGAEVTTDAPPIVPVVEVPSVGATDTVGQPMNCGLCNSDGAGSTDPMCIACGGSGKLIRTQ